MHSEGPFLDLIKIALRVRADAAVEFQQNKLDQGRISAGTLHPFPERALYTALALPADGLKGKTFEDESEKLKGGARVCSECGVKNSGQLVHTAHVRALHLRTVLVCLWCGEQCGYQTRYMKDHVRPCLQQLFAGAEGMEQ